MESKLPETNRLFFIVWDRTLALSSELLEEYQRCRKNDNREAADRAMERALAVLHVLCVFGEVAVAGVQHDSR